MAIADSEAETRHKEYEHHEKPTLERLTGWGTLALAIFTALLFLFTAFLWWVTLQLSKDAKASGETQSASMAASIAQAARAASAMEQVASHTETNTRITTKFLEKQMRAYISVDFNGAIYQEVQKNLRFGGDPVLSNTGFTPARKVNYWCRAAVLPTELPHDYVFPEGGVIATDVGMSPLVDVNYPGRSATTILAGGSGEWIG